MPPATFEISVNCLWLDNLVRLAPCYQALEYWNYRFLLELFPLISWLTLPKLPPCTEQNFTIDQLNQIVNGNIFQNVCTEKRRLNHSVKELAA